jgi:hypothetical protein
VAHPLDGCRAKLDWAEKHLDALSEEMRTFMQRDADAFTTEYDAAENAHIVRFREERELPVEWGLALGDVVQNTRSALDHLVYQLVLLAKAKPHTSHQFPIIDSPNDWLGKVVNPPLQGNRGQLDFIDPGLVTMIEALQPYQPTTGLPRLALIRRFSNTDKHRLIHGMRVTLAQTPDLTARMWVPSEITNLTFPPPDTAIEHGTEIARYQYVTDFVFLPDESGAPATLQNAQVDVKANFHLSSLFGEPGAEDTRAREFRYAIADIRGIVAAFDRFF